MQKRHLSGRSFARLREPAASIKACAPLRELSIDPVHARRLLKRVDPVGVPQPSTFMRPTTLTMPGGQAPRVPSASSVTEASSTAEFETICQCLLFTSCQSWTSVRDHLVSLCAPTVEARRATPLVGPDLLRSRASLLAAMHVHRPVHADSRWMRPGPTTQFLRVSVKHSAS
jgi:hypothetical protein